ncbi:hypothetical protein RQP46_005305 [Phenoliferia psychrophenolica]
MRLPEELLHAIISCLLEPADDESTAGPTMDERRTLWAAGSACCLVSHRRTVSLGAPARDQDADPLPARKLLARVAHLVEHPHLAAFVRSYTVEINSALTNDEVEAIRDVFRVCLNLTSVEILECPLDDSDEDENNPDAIEEEEDRRERCRQTLITFLLSSPRTKELRHLTLTSDESGWGLSIGLLELCGQLRSLTVNQLYPAPPHPLAPTPISVPLSLSFPFLRRVDISNVHDDLTSAIVAGSPLLHTMHWYSRHAPSLPKIENPHPTLSGLTCQLLRNALGAVVPWDLDAQLADLSTFIASFPSLKRLELLLESYPVTQPTAPPTTPTLAGSTHFLTSLPPTLSSLTLFGRAITRLTTAITPLLSSSPPQLPSLRSYTPVWNLPITVLKEEWEPLHDACLAAGVEPGGSLLLLFTQDLVKSRIEALNKARADLIAMEDKLLALWNSMDADARVENGWDPETL